MTTTIIIVLSVLLITSIVVNTIQYKRQVKLENSINEIQFDESEYIKFFEELHNGINYAYTNMVRIDRSGAFKNEDEVGYTFTSLYKIVNDLNQFLNDAKSRFEGEEEEKK